MPRWLWWVLGVVLLVGTATAVWRRLQEDRQARLLAEAQLNQQRRITDSVVARLALAEQVVDSLPALHRLVRETQAKLLAGVRVVVPGDTVHDTVEVSVPTPDLPRMASVTRSTDRCEVVAEATAPPHPAPLTLTTQLRQRPFAAEVGFVRAGDSVIAVVASGADSIRVGVPYWAPTRKPPHDIVGVRVQGLVGQQLLTKPTAVGRIQGFFSPTRQWGLIAELETRAAPGVVTWGVGVQRTF